MFEYIYGWVQDIAFYLVLITVLLHMLPDSDYKKYIRFFTGLILILLLITPVLKLFHIDYWITDLYGSREYQKQVCRMEEAAQLLNEADASGTLMEVEESQGETREEEKNKIEVEEIRIEK